MLIVTVSCQTIDEALTKPDYHHAALINTRLGLLYLQQGDTMRGRQRILQALEQDPGSAAVNSGMAILLEKCGDIDKAYVYSQKSVHLAGNNSAFIARHAGLLCRTGRTEEALVYFDKALQNEKYADLGATFAQAADCAEARGDHKRADNYLQKARMYR